MIQTVISIVIMLITQVVSSFSEVLIALFSGLLILWSVAWVRSFLR